MQNQLTQWQSDPQAKADVVKLAAEVFNIAPADVDRDDVRAAIMKAMNTCLTYGLIPAQDVWMLGFNKSEQVNGKWTKKVVYSVDIGVQAWEKFANATAPNGWFPEYQTMTTDEVKRQLGSDYLPGCLGYQCRIWMVNQVSIMQQVGVQPEWYNGYYLVEMKKDYNSGQMVPTAENIPSYRSAEDVAKRRALKHALSRNFSPRYVGDLGSEPEKNLYYALRDAKESMDDRNLPPAVGQDSLPANRPVVVEDEHGILMAYVGDKPGKAYPVPEDDDVSYGFSRDTDNFVNWCRLHHANSSGECEPKQHGYLTGLINKIIGSEDEQDHRDVMAELVGRPVDKDHRMGAELADALIPLISETKRGPTPKSRIPNPDYDQDVVDSIFEIWDTLPVHPASLLA